MRIYIEGAGSLDASDALAKVEQLDAQIAGLEEGVRLLFVPCEAVA